MPLMILNALEGKPLPIYGDGLNVRDWLYVDDHVAALALVLEKGRVGQTYNIGGGQEMTNIDLVRMLCDRIDRRFADDDCLRKRFPYCPAAAGQSCRSLISFVKDRPGHDRRYAICADKLSTELCFRAQTTLADGIVRTIDWYLANESWWRPTQNGDDRDWSKQQYGAAE